MGQEVRAEGTRDVRGEVGIFLACLSAWWPRPPCRRRRHFAEVVVIRDGPLFIRPLFPLALSQRGFHPSPTERERGRGRANGEEIDPLFRVSHSNATYVREAPVS